MLPFYLMHRITSRDSFFLLSHVVFLSLEVVPLTSCPLNHPFLAPTLGPALPRPYLLFCFYG